jgi:hypothetical protein
MSRSLWYIYYDLFLLIMVQNNFTFGSKPRMKEVLPGTEAIFRFLGKGKVVDTDYGEKVSFPISLISHDSYPQLKDGAIEMAWESKCQAATQLLKELSNEKSKFHKELVKAFEESKWQLTRFDTGAYFISVIK